MCLSMAIKAGIASGMFKKAGQISPAQNIPTTKAVNKEREKVAKKAAKRVRPRNLRMRGGAGNRSMFGNQENKNANG